MKNYLSILLFSLSGFTYAQEIRKVPIDIIDHDYLYVNDGDSKELHYYEIVPDKGPIGVIIVLPMGAELTEDTLKSISLHKIAAEYGVLTIVPSINWSTDTGRAEIGLLDTIFQKVVAKYDVPKNNFVLGGLSNGGMISLIYAERAVQNPENTFLRPKGIFALDTPLDDSHMYEYCEREVQRNFSEAVVAEAKYILSEYTKTHGGSPREFPEKYIESSIYSHGTEDGGNAKYLKDIPIRMYTDLDVEWLLNERHRDLYDWNGTDMVAMINRLKLQGNTDANVRISQGKGVRLDGTRHPHSWSILDTEDCITWILDLFKG